LKRILKNDSETAKNVSEVDKAEKTDKVVTVEIPQANLPDNTDKSPSAENNGEVERKIEIKKPTRQTPKLDSIIDCLHYKVCLILFVI